MAEKFYHLILPHGHYFYESPVSIREKGLKFSARTNNWYLNGGNVRPDLTQRFKPEHVPDWVNFERSVKAAFSPPASDHIEFPILTDRILVFNQEVSISLYDQALHGDLRTFADEEAEGFDTGESEETWVQAYWDSMQTLAEYIEHPRYPEAEVHIFQEVPPSLLTFKKHKE